MNSKKQAYSINTVHDDTFLGVNQSVLQGGTNRAAQTAE